MTESSKHFREGDMIKENVFIIDNGKDKIILDRSKITQELSHAGVTEDTISRMLSVVERFANEVSQERLRGTHLGSTALNHAVNSEFWNMKPEDLGFKTDLELKLASKLIENLITREE